MIGDGSVDLAIVPNPDNLTGLAFQPIAASERVIITPHNHPLLVRPLKSLSDLAIYPLILLGYRTHTRTLLEEAFEEQGLSYEVAIELDSMDMVKRYVEIGLGVGVAHRAALDNEDLSHLGVVPLGAFLPSELVGIVTRKDRQLSGYASDFASVLSLTLRSGKGSRPIAHSVRKSRAQPR
jgi:DNA-binding transcriptional LysR family regulator